MYRSTHVEINLNNIKTNVNNIINKYNDYKYYIAVIKGNCYGHGYKIIDTLIQSGINYLAVSTLDEALKVRVINKKIPILCLQPIDNKYLEICSKENITITIHNLEYAKLIKNIDYCIKVHIKVDSGMSRLGFNDKQELADAIKIIKKNSNIEIEGIFTHMGTSGIGDNYRNKQLDDFENITSLIDLNDFKIIHADRSVTLQCQKKIPYCNSIRLGIIMYGFAQKKIVRSGISKLKYIIKKKIYKFEDINYDDINVSTAFALYSKVIQVKKVRAGSLVGYGTGYKAERDIHVATIEIGYCDGINLNYNNNDVVINNRRYRIIGTINMGMISAEVDETVKENDIVELFGKNISIREAAKKAKTSVYQLLTGVPETVPRVYLKDGKEI